MRRKRLSVALVVVAGVFAVLAIETLENWSGKRETETPLLLGTNLWLGYEPLFLARDLGHFDENSVRLVECASSSQVIRQFRDNTIQAAALTMDEVLLLRERGLDLRVVLVMDISQGGDAILAQGDVQDLADLRGRKVGVENSALGAFVLTRALQKVDLSVQDVTIVSVEADEHEQTFLSQKIDAVVTFDPVRSRLLAAGAIQLFDSNDMPNEIVDVLVVRADAWEQHQSHLITALRGWFQALEYLEQNPDEALRSVSLRIKLTPEQIRQSQKGLHAPNLQQNLSLLAGQPSPLEENAHRLSKVMVDNALLGKEVVLSDCISAEPLMEVSAR
ncbi:ABC transporter substrate-binding protein [Stieleria sp.]|uniref:ABC transporter substrate-binding protein n=1 Tax=Stieleria sp. TaxID=2795976 RepID=UPI0035634CF0